MKRRIIVACALIMALGLAFGTALAMMHEHGGGGGEACAYCGMNLEKFAHSRMSINYDDGSVVQACSIHCAAVDLALKIDRTPVSIKVADYDSREMLDAEAAVWVIGGSRPGVMTRSAKWAFGDRGAADAFIKENGGLAADFDLAMSQTYGDMYKDTKMIREKRMKMKGGPHGM